MNPLQIPVRDRVLSRVVFYLLVGLVFWGVGLTQPSQSQIAAQKDQQLGVAKAYFAVPIDPDIIRASR